MHKFQLFTLSTLLAACIACAGSGSKLSATGSASMVQDQQSTSAALSSSEEEPLLQVGIVIVDGVYNTELTAPMDMFHHTVFHAKPGCRVFTVAPSLDPITSFEGLRILPDFSFSDCPPIDILVVPSAEHSMDSDLENRHLIDFVRERGKRASWLLSLCDGAFVLAAAGLLDDLHATTFPADLDRFEAQFPAVRVERNLSFVRHGKAVTSVGGEPSFEAALYLCQLLYGPKAARGIARGLVIDWDLTAIDHLELKTASFP